MSQENVEVVRRSFETWVRGGTDALVEVLDPGIEWTLRPDFPDAGVFRGQDEVRGLFRRFEETFDDLGMEPLEFIEAGDQVVVPLNWWGRGKESGVEVAERQGETWVITVRAGKIAVVTEYRRKAEALEAVGLPE
ncbi:MAG TPA: nuclear transport factor 2 family protein [Solirubrobacteraceae bacterium]|nr:nuclear transport factor 2 family protein [Solirubrobacteraceae bacterium]